MALTGVGRGMVSVPAVPPVVLQVDVGVTVEPLLGLAGSAVSAFLTTLLVGAVLVAVAPAYTDDRMAAVLDDPVGTFVYGVAALLLLVLAAIVLVVTIVGILVAIPLLAAGYVVWALGSAVAFLAIADRLVGREDGWLPALLVAAVLDGGLVLTGVGGLVAFAVGAAGFGAVLEPYL